MESLCEYISKGRIKNEVDIIQQLEQLCLTADGEDINFLFFQESPERLRTYRPMIMVLREEELNYCYGTLLHYSISNNYKRIVQYALRRGASIAIETTYKRLIENNKPRVLNALEIAGDQVQCYSHSEELFQIKGSIFEMLKKRSLEVYSQYGVTPLHIDCTVDLYYWSDRNRRSLRTADVNARISTESPLWPGMTPILIATKLFNTHLVDHLFRIGADPLVRDVGGNSVLHYVDIVNDEDFFDEKLYAPAGRDTFGSINGESHFHMACRHVEAHGKRALALVKRYLDEGISPDLPMLSCAGYRRDDCDAGKAGMHIAAEYACLELVQLLLEHGADVNKKDARGRTPVELLGTRIDQFFRKVYTTIDCLCLFIEAGSNQNKINWNELLDDVSSDKKLTILRCIQKLMTIDKRLVSKKLMNIFDEISSQPVLGWDEADHARHCKLELQTLSSLGLHQILDGTMIVRRDFKDKFEDKLGCLDFESYPIYGYLLKIIFKRKLLEFEEKRKTIPQAIPQIKKTFQSLCHLPDLCAESILWNLQGNDLYQFDHES